MMRIKIIAENRVKLAELSALLRKPPKDHQWSYNSVGGPGFKIEKLPGTKTGYLHEVQNHCGSAGCAIGLWNAVHNRGVLGIRGSYRGRPTTGNRDAENIIYYGYDLRNENGLENGEMWNKVKPVDVAECIDRALKSGRVGLRDILILRLAKEKGERAARRSSGGTEYYGPR